MKTLLPYSSPLYLKRMARALNGAPAGFYHDGSRFFRATFSKGCLVISRATEWNVSSGAPTGFEVRKFSDLTDVSFGDGNGSTICASRHS